MDYLSAIILGAIEGLTEFLPISSTGHLILASTLMGIVHTPFHKTFEIVVQFGAIAAVIALYWRSLLNRVLLQKLIVAFIPTGIVGVIFYPFIKGYLIGNELVVVVSLVVGGVVLILFEWWYAKNTPTEDAVHSISYRQALAVGIFQSIAVIPGVSRSAATIMGGLIAGIPRAAIVEFSFLLAVPTMLIASGYDLLHIGYSLTAHEYTLLGIGCATSFIVALFAMRFLVRFVRTHTFVPFGVYRIVAGLLFFWLVLA